MKAVSRRIICLCLALLMGLSLVSGSARAVGSVCFTAVNDQLLPLNDETMPFWSNSTFYIPYTAVENGELDIYSSRNQDRSTVVLYRMRSAITFNYANGTIETNTGQNYSGGPVVRGGVIFVPLDVLCRFFNLSYSYSRITYGYLLRVKNDAAVLSDAKFVDAAMTSFSSRYVQYERSHAPVVAEPPPVAQEAPVEEEKRTEEELERTVYLVVEATDAAHTEQILAYLSTGHVTILFSEQSMIGSDHLLRRLSAGDGEIALRVDASAGAETTLAHIDEANEQLWAVANTKTRLVRLEGAGEETTRAVVSAGFCPIRYALDFSDGGSTASRMTSRIQRAADANRGSCCAFLGTDVTASRQMSALLIALRAGNCTLMPLNEVILGRR